MEAPARAPAPVGILRGHKAPVNTVCAVSSTTVASGGADGVVKLWDLKSRREATSVDAHSKAGLLEVAQLDAAHFLTHGRDGYIKLWDISTFNASAKPTHEWYCGSFTFTKATTMRWRDADGADDLGDLILSPSANEKDVRIHDGL
jgi:WD40 repeat protein